MQYIAHEVENASQRSLDMSSGAIKREIRVTLDKEIRNRSVNFIRGAVHEVLGQEIRKETKLYLKEIMGAQDSGWEKVY